MTSSTRTVRFLDLSVHDETERSALHNALDHVLDHGQLVMGVEIERFESKLSKFVGREYCVSASSGTGALYLALKARGIGSGDEVITTSLSWIATANAIAMTGATPVFADISDDLNIDTSSIEHLISNKTKALLSVDYTGNPCKYSELNDICSSYSLDLIQDASQAFGAKYADSYCGSQGTISAISHNPMKVFCGLGEAGSVFTDSQNDYEIANYLRYNGTINKEFLKEPSLNFRMDALQASFLSGRLDICLKNIQRRNDIASFYDKALSEVGDLVLPQTTKNSTRVFYTYTILTNSRNELSKHLSNLGIENKIQHPLLMSQQDPYIHCKSSTTQAEKLVNNILCIPIHHKLSEDDLDYVVNSIKSFFK